MSAAHTPGPWFATEDSVGRPCVATAKADASGNVRGYWIAECVGGTPPSDDMESSTLANARLIAAAPELLSRTDRSRSACLQVAEILRQHVAGCEVNGMDATAQSLRDSIALLYSTAKASDAAIAKATGGEA